MSGRRPPSSAGGARRRQLEPDRLGMVEGGRDGVGGDVPRRHERVPSAPLTHDRHGLSGEGGAYLRHLDRPPIGQRMRGDLDRVFQR